MSSKTHAILESFPYEFIAPALIPLYSSPLWTVVPPLSHGMGSGPWSHSWLFLMLEYLNLIRNTLLSTFSFTCLSHIILSRPITITAQSMAHDLGTLTGLSTSDLSPPSCDVFCCQTHLCQASKTLSKALESTIQRLVLFVPTSSG